MTNFNNAEWDESKHPRDNEGKFTFKNGGRESIKDVLYGTIEKLENKTKLFGLKLNFGYNKNYEICNKSY